MKILVLQPGQLGDLLLTLPVLKAIKRANPTAIVHVVVQDEYCDFVKTAGFVDICISSHGISQKLDLLMSENYSQVINLASTAAAADLTFLVGEEKGAVTSGYSRNPDGSLKISDDASGYIFAQCGPNKAGRLHVLDLFSSLASVDIDETDLNVFPSENKRGQTVLVQVGNISQSREHTLRTWKLSLLKLATYFSGEVIFVGGLEHRADAAYLTSHVKSKRFKNLTGKLNASELIDLAKTAKCLISCGDLLSEIATITNTPCIELSSSNKNFWETGPLSDSSVVLPRFNSDVTDEYVASAVINFVQSLAAPDHGYNTKRILAQGEFERFTGPISPTDNQWKIIKALYLPSDFPQINDVVFNSALEKLKEANVVAIEQINAINQKNAEQLSDVLKLFDDVILAVQSISPTIKPLNDWFFAERARIGSEALEVTKNKYFDLHKKYELVCDALSPQRSMDRGSSKDNDIQL